MPGAKETTTTPDLLFQSCSTHQDDFEMGRAASAMSALPGLPRDEEELDKEEEDRIVRTVMALEQGQAPPVVKMPGISDDGGSHACSCMKTLLKV